MPWRFSAMKLLRHRKECAVGLLLLVSCTPRTDDDTHIAMDSVAVPELSYPVNRALGFDPESVRVGQRIGSFIIERLDVQKATDGRFVGWVLFTGEAEISGVVMRNPDPELNDLCIELDSTSARRVPRWPGAARRSWLCFTNAEGNAVERGAYDGGETLRAVIDQLRVVRYETDAYNTARLVRVVEPGTE